MRWNLKEVGADNLKPARERTGSTDFCNVTYILPGACIRVHFVPDGIASHSQTFLDYGKSEDAHKCVIDVVKILAATVLDLAENDNIKKIKEEFQVEKSKL